MICAISKIVHAISKVIHATKGSLQNVYQHIPGQNSSLGNGLPNIDPASDVQVSSQLLVRDWLTPSSSGDSVCGSEGGFTSPA